MDNWPVLQDTHNAVAALEILGGLDQIDREACIQRTLKLHRGGEYFAPPLVDQPWRLKISGDARGTLAAFETLRILGALDRVHDLERWRFRVSKRRAPTPISAVPWTEIEASVAQQRFERFLRERSHHPRNPPRSLLAP
jgi:hypothetical protein